MQNKRDRLATIKDVAAKAGVSAATVSRAFDPKWEGKLTDDTREKVMDAARALAYRPNAIARSLHVNRTNIIAVVMGTQIGYFFEEIFFELVNRIQRGGKQVLVFSADPTQGLEKIVDQVHQYRVDAILIMSNATSNTIVQSFQETSIPILLFDRLIQSSSVSYVCSDNIMGARIAADFLLENGHRRIGYVSGDASTSQSLERSMSFTSRVSELDGVIAARYEGDYTYESGRAAMRHFTCAEGLDAIFCADDTMAMGVIDQARELGLRVPEDISVMGFDNHSVARLSPYRLTTVSHQREKLFETIIASLDQMVCKPETKVYEMFSMELKVGQSVALM